MHWLDTFSQQQIGSSAETGIIFHSLYSQRLQFFRQFHTFTRLFLNWLNPPEIPESSSAELPGRFSPWLSPPHCLLRLLQRRTAHRCTERAPDTTRSYARDYTLICPPFRARGRVLSLGLACRRPPSITRNDVTPPAQLCSPGTSN